MAQIPLLVIQGPTASGKTGWAIRLAKFFPLEVISADSRQVYRRMDIGTAKASLEERAGIPHHMLDLIDPDESYSVGDFVTAAREIATEIFARGKLPCVVGGTGLYTRALMGGLADVPRGDDDLRIQLNQREEQLGPGTLYADLQQIDPVSASGVHPHNLVKIIRALEVWKLTGERISDLQRKHGFVDPLFKSLSFVPDWSKETLHQRIAERTRHMVDNGLIEETAALVADYGENLKSLQTLGYREALAYLRGEASRDEIKDMIALQTRRYAKRQLTWFRKESETIWVDSCQESDRVLDLIDNLILP
ncbi:tRNA (adenosine(37)-N6)-dimethylallyltransferase MiaA [Geopsychrobacter electrodiphilus]|uniref:tRNA (adenosine(37)-N6)-dimethylallyltransferase MiaA n=1 Tax=Geopsychrobacter electrodiphilus TaxID=225196 RepID=UPI000366C09C|nr:tRNA (adenosine(37)-N6)-dimethylallyltransferase MiaA [Geopsychrobacter electrodiphilus]